MRPVDNRPTTGITLTEEFSCGTHRAWELQWKPDNSAFAFSSSDRTLAIVSGATYGNQQIIDRFAATKKFGWSATGAFFAHRTGGTVEVLDSATGRTVGRFANSGYCWGGTNDLYVVDLAVPDCIRHYPNPSNLDHTTIPLTSSSPIYDLLYSHSQLALVFRSKIELLSVASDDPVSGGFFDIAGPALVSVSKARFDGSLIRSLSWNRKLNCLALASDINPSEVRIIRPDLGHQVVSLQGHRRPVAGVAFNSDGDLLATASEDQSVRIWCAKTWRCLASIGSNSRAAGVAFREGKNELSYIAEDGAKIRVVTVDAGALLSSAPDEADVKYTTARIVLLGDSGVGKTGLGWRLAHEEFREHESTHGRQFWIVRRLANTLADGTACEAVIWDLAGQPDYRLTHALYLDSVDVALILFDATNRLQPLVGAEYWLKQLSVAGTAKSKILVAARTDRGMPTLSSAEIEDFSRRYKIDGGFVSTSALTGNGVETLLQRIAERIDWKSKAKTVSSGAYKAIKDTILAFKEEASSIPELLRTPGILRDRLRESAYITGISGDELEEGVNDGLPEPSDDVLDTALSHLESHGYIAKLKDVEANPWILVAPELLDRLAASIVLEARREPRGLGAIEEDRLMTGGYGLTELASATDADQRLLLGAVMTRFFQSSVCFRERHGNSTLVIFPSLINELRHAVPNDVDTHDDVAYLITGSTETVYPSLVVLLGYTSIFKRTSQWRNEARYSLEDDNEICAFRQLQREDGSVELVLSYAPTVSQPARLMFQGMVERLLLRHNIEIFRFHNVICDQSTCRHNQDRAIIIKQTEAGKNHGFCSECGAKYVIPKRESLGLSPTENTEVRRQTRVLVNRSAFEEALIPIKALRRKLATGAREPRCFISYAWGNSDIEKWVWQLATDLRHADVDVLFDRWHGTPGTSLPGFISNIGSCDCVVVVGTPTLRDKYESAAKGHSDPVLAAELDLIEHRITQPNRYGRRVFPIIRAGTARESLTPMLEKLVSINFANDEQYFSSILTLIWAVHDLPTGHPVLNDALAEVRVATSMRDFKTS